MSRNRILLVASILVLSLALFGCSSQAASSKSSSDSQLGQSSASSAVSSSASASSSSASSSTSASKPTIKESAWWVYKDDSGTYVSIAVLLENPDKVNSYTMLPVTMTAKDASGTAIATQEFDVPSIMPGDIVPYTNTFSIDSEPQDVSFEMYAGTGKTPDKAYTLASFAIANDSEKAGDNGNTTWAGEVTNNSGADFPNGYWAYVLLYKDGELVGGYGAYSDTALAKDQVVSFSIDSAFVSSVQEHDSYKLYVVPDTV